MSSAAMSAVAFSLWSALHLIRELSFAPPHTIHFWETRDINLQSLKNDAEAKARAGFAKIVYLHPEKSGGCPLLAGCVTFEYFAPPCMLMLLARNNV